MKKILLLGLTILFIAYLYADWNPGDPSKWEQLPELSENGFDVDATADLGQQQPPHILADDFLCTETGNITAIHFWGSWYHDEFPYYECPEAVEFTISIHADIPAGVAAEYSMPGEVLWFTTFSPTVDDIVWYHEGYEGWFDPVTGFSELNSDYYCIEYNFFVPPEEQFLQEGTEENPIVYWLDIQATPLDQEEVPDARFGWKTSATHWNDDGTWAIGEEPYNGTWNELRNPENQEESLDLAFVIVTEEPQVYYEYGDAPEGENAIAYPSLGVTGSFPTCVNCGPAGYIQHGMGDEPLLWFGQNVDLELEGDAGLCPNVFPSYDDDECFNDNDAGLSITESYTIDGSNNVITCPLSAGVSLGGVCTVVTWGLNLDMEVHNHYGDDVYVNVLFDWNQNGSWQNDAATQCSGVMAPEYVLVDFPIPSLFDGNISLLNPPPFTVGPNSGYVWARFSVTEVPINNPNWDGSGSFMDGETEDYLIKIDEGAPEELDFGDAPDPSYPTLLANNGARHIIDGVTFLGSSVDAETDGQQNADATGDDVAVSDDEDGIVFPAPLIVGEQGAIIASASVIGYLNAWIDFNGNGSWADAGEQIITDKSLNPGANLLNFMIPSTAIIGNTFARFRFDSAGGLSYNGQANDGEVEDYMITIDEPIDDGMKMHYHQWPDTTWFGVDVSATQDDNTIRFIADDFLCTETGIINSIHIWGSWQNDEIPADASFELGIWSDNPAGEQGWSEPDQMLWLGDFWPGDYSEQLYYQTPNGEHWYDPCTGNFVFPGDYQVWEYDFTIPNGEAFLQEEGTVYWLSVREFGTVGEGSFGWKTSVNHWNDDAAYLCQAPPAPWTELIYPMGHPYNPQGEQHNSMDMAFYIDCHPTAPENVTITVDNVNVTVSWSANACANSYNVYSSTDPYATFPSGWTFETTTTSLSWSEPKSGAGNKKFYRVTSIK